jgi:two-component system, chemotaxis family, CheB/CheR fusion protein
MLFACSLQRIGDFWRRTNSRREYGYGMQKLLNSTEVATLFLDNELKIKRYTEPARQLINLIQTDIGRPLAHLASSLAYEKLVDDCRELLRTLAFKLAEVRFKQGRWYLMRIMPYRTAENVIDGVIITIVDISPVKAAEKSLLRMSKVFLDGPEPVIILDLSGRITDLNDEAERACGWSRQEMLGQQFQSIISKARKETADDALDRCLAGEIVCDVECGSVTKAGRALPDQFTLKLLTDDRGRPDTICMIAKHLVA